MMLDVFPQTWGRQWHPGRLAAVGRRSCADTEWGLVCRTGMVGAWVGHVGQRVVTLITSIMVVLQAALLNCWLP
jgi:hypothetical protein